MASLPANFWPDLWTNTKNVARHSLVGVLVGGVIGAGASTIASNSANETADRNTSEAILAQQEAYESQFAFEREQSLKDIKRPAYESFVVTADSVEKLTTARRESGCAVALDVKWVSTADKPEVACGGPSAREVEEAKSAFDEAVRKARLVASKEATELIDTVATNVNNAFLNRTPNRFRWDSAVPNLQSMPAFDRLYICETNPHKADGC